MSGRIGQYPAAGFGHFGSTNANEAGFGKIGAQRVNKRRTKCIGAMFRST
jgi:hypothetical protein